jgi:hypothetical protein
MFLMLMNKVNYGMKYYITGVIVKCKCYLKWYLTYLQFLPPKLFVKVVFLVNIIWKCLRKVNIGVLNSNYN